MKFLASAVLIVFLSAVLVHGGNHAEEMMKIAKECKDSIGATEDDIAKIAAREEVTSETGKCMFKCIMEKSGVIKDGMLIKEGALECVKSFGLSDDLAQVIVDECSKISDSSPCDYALKVANCFKENGKKNGFSIGI